MQTTKLSHSGFSRKAKEPPSAHGFFCYNITFLMVRPLGAQMLELENCNGNRGDPGPNPISRLILFQVSFHLFNIIANSEDH